METCTAVVPAAKESPTFQGLSAGQRVPTFPSPSCCTAHQTQARVCACLQAAMSTLCPALVHDWSPAHAGERSGDPHVPGLRGRRAEAGLRGFMPRRLPRRPGRVYSREQRPERLQGAARVHVPACEPHAQYGSGGDTDGGFAAATAWATAVSWDPES